MRLLVVEDDPDLNRQLVTALEEAGYVVDSATDGEEGHFLGDTEPYDAVILDLGLPEMDGVTVLEKWRRDGRIHRHNDNPVLGRHDLHVIGIAAKAHIEKTPRIGSKRRLLRLARGYGLTRTHCVARPVLFGLVAAPLGRYEKRFIRPCRAKPQREEEGDRQGDPYGFRRHHAPVLGHRR